MKTPCTVPPTGLCCRKQHCGKHARKALSSVTPAVMAPGSIIACIANFSSCAALQLPPDSAEDTLAELRQQLEPSGIPCFGGLPVRFATLVVRRTSCHCPRILRKSSAGALRELSERSRLCCTWQRRAPGGTGRQRIFKPSAGAPAVQPDAPPLYVARKMSLVLAATSLPFWQEDSLLASARLDAIASGLGAKLVAGQHDLLDASADEVRALRSRTLTILTAFTQILVDRSGWCGALRRAWPVSSAGSLS